MTSARYVNREDGGVLSAPRRPQSDSERVQVCRTLQDLSWKQVSPEQTSEQHLCDITASGGKALGLLGKSERT